MDINKLVFLQTINVKNLSPEKSISKVYDIHHITSKRFNDKGFYPVIVTLEGDVTDLRCINPINIDDDNVEEFMQLLRSINESLQK